MRKFISVVIVLILIMNFASCKEKDAFAYNMPGWMEFGMEKEDVTVHYDDDPFDYGNGKISGLMYEYNEYNENDVIEKTIIEYAFEENKLFFLNYKLELRNDDLSDSSFISEYDYLKNRLTNIYGEPLYEEEIWFDEKQKDDEDMINQVIEKGDCLKVTLWQIDDLYISLSLFKDIDIMYANQKNSWFTYTD